MLQPPPGTRVFLACGATDMRKGFDGLAAPVLSRAQLSMLLEGIDWRMPAWTARPETAV